LLEKQIQKFPKKLQKFDFFQKHLFCSKIVKNDFFCMKVISFESSDNFAIKISIIEVPTKEDMLLKQKKI
jgi:hypothetical protein